MGSHEGPELAARPGNAECSNYRSPKAGATAGSDFRTKANGSNSRTRAALGSAVSLTNSLYVSTAIKNQRTEQKETVIEAELKTLAAEPSEWETAYDEYMAQKVIENWRQAEQEVYPEPKEPTWWADTKSFFSENIFQPFNTNIFQPFLKPALQTTVGTISSGLAWTHKNVYQTYIQPTLDKTIPIVADTVSWGTENFYQPYVKPAQEKLIQTISAGVSWANENVYQPNLKPLVDKTKPALMAGVSWVSENFYQPYVQPALSAAKEKLYQPYIKPLVDEAKQIAAQSAAWIDRTIYEPYIEPGGQQH